MKETRFKQTEIGLLPEDWNVTTLSRVCKIFGRIGYRGYSTADIVTPENGAISISPTNIINGQMDYTKCTYISWYKYEESPEIKIYNGDILIVKTGSTYGKSALVKGLVEKATINPQIVVLKDINIDNVFLSYVCLIPQFLEQVESVIVGGAIPTLSQKKMGQFIIPQLCIKEQKKIASALTSIDNLLFSLEKLIEKKRLIKQGAMQELLTGKKRLPGFAGEWVEKKLGEVATFVNGNGFPLIYQGFKHGAYPFYKVSDLSSKGNERKMYKANNYVDDQIVKKIYCNIIPEKSVIFAKIGAAIFLERKRLTTCKCCIDNNMMAMIMYGDIDCLFMLYYLESISLSSISNATALPSIRAKDIAELILRFPSNRLEQEAIASILESMDKEIESLETKKAKYEQIKQGMIQQLLTGKIRLTVI